MILNQISQRPVWIKTGLLVFVVFILTISCTREEEVKELRPESNVQIQTQVESPEQSLEKLLPLQGKIIQQPENVEYRKELITAAVDVSHKTIRAAGTGLYPEDASNSAIGRQSAERAAYLDACRWTAYLLKWKENPESPAFGEISGEIPGAKLLLKKTTDDGKSVALVEISLEN
ncbi:hypothetical protein JXQ31_17820 [candidate division KSB1 bacterium]|nr:hypothetical protein [candidate division KSB1 bacterium]